MTSVFLKSLRGAGAQGTIKSKLFSWLADALFVPLRRRLQVHRRSSVILVANRPGANDTALDIRILALAGNPAVIMAGGD
jgi:hypothetical protein